MGRSVGFANDSVQVEYASVGDDEFDLVDHIENAPWAAR